MDRQSRSCWHNVIEAEVQAELTAKMAACGAHILVNAATNHESNLNK